MNIKEIKNITNFTLNNNGFMVEYTENDVKKQYGSTDRTEMGEFAKILSKRLKPAEGVINK